MSKVLEFGYRAIGFKPYKIGNKTGWVKEVSLDDGIRYIFRKLPSGTISRTTKSSNNWLWDKNIIRADGVEITSSWAGGVEQRAICSRDRKGNGFFARTKVLLGGSKQYKNLVTPQIYKDKLFSFVDKWKMKLGII